MHVPTLRLTMLLKVRQAVRDHRQQALAEVLKQEQLLTHRLLAVDEELIELKRTVEVATAAAPVLVQRRVDPGHHEHSLVARRRELKRDLAELLLEVDRRQQALLAAETELRAMENIRQALPSIHDEHQQRLQSCDRNQALLR